MTIRDDRRRRLERRSQPERRGTRALPAEHDFSATSLGISVICVVVAVMLSV
jgi:hypothetical protein